MKFRDWLEIMGDALIVIFGVILVYIFWTIAVCGSWGKEDNPLILKLELAMGIIIMIFGIYHIVKDVIRINKK
jgi:xanthine/uracil permease